MAFQEIINNIFFSKHFVSAGLPNETINNLTVIYKLHQIGNHPLIIRGLFSPYDDFLFNPYFQLTIVLLGYFWLDSLFDELIWPYIKPYRDNIRRKLIACLTKRNLKFLKMNLKKN